MQGFLRRFSARYGGSLARLVGAFAFVLVGTLTFVASGSVMAAWIVGVVAGISLGILTKTRLALFVYGRGERAG